jgi:hypothetical protein
MKRITNDVDCSASLVERQTTRTSATGKAATNPPSSTTNTERIASYFSELHLTEGALRNTVSWAMVLQSKKANTACVALL